MEGVKPDDFVLSINNYVLTNKYMVNKLYTYIILLYKVYSAEYLHKIALKPVGIHGFESQLMRYPFIPTISYKTYIEIN